MTDHSLDRRVAEIVGLRRDSQGRLYCAFAPSDEIEDAIAALEAMREKGWRWELEGWRVKSAPFVCLLYDADEKCASAESETLPLAICKAIVATEEK